MEKKDKITYTLQELKKEPERYKKLQEFAISKLTPDQIHSPIFESLLDLKMREILSEYT